MSSRRTCRRSHRSSASSLMKALMCFLVLFAAFGGGAAAMEMKGPAIGIDLGTTYSVVGVWRNGGVEIIPNEMGNRITPSVVAFMDSERLIGDGAKMQSGQNPLNTIYSAKRLIGRQFNDRTVQDDRRLLSYNVTSGKHGAASISVEYQDSKTTFSPEEISSMVLSKLKRQAEEYLGKDLIENAVITVPAYFDDTQRQATRDAGRIAGFKSIRILNEPTSAAIAYGMKEREGQRVLVFDLGGGTFDVSLLEVDDGFFEVLSTAGDTHLGGEDFDNRMVDHFVRMFRKKYGTDLSTNKAALAKLRRGCESAKRQLSTQHEARVEVEGVVDGMDFSEKLTRSKFEELNADLFKKTLNPVERVLKDAGLGKEDIAEVVLVGGSTRIPKVQGLLSKFFDGKKLHSGINPDESVAYGAAVQAAVLSGEDVNALVVETLPLSVGIETVGGIMTKVIGRGEMIPTKKTQSFTTNVDNQASVGIQVFQGERALTQDNRLLGRFELNGIPPAARGVPQVAVTFEVDEDGLLQVSAEEKVGNTRKEISIQNSMGGLTDAEIEEKVRDAKQFEEADRTVREVSEVRQKLEAAAYSLKQQLNDDEGNLANAINDENDQMALRKAVARAIAWLDEHQNSNLSEVEEQLREFEQVTHPIISSVYDQQRDYPGDEL